MFVLLNHLQRLRSTIAAPARAEARLARAAPRRRGLMQRLRARADRHRQPLLRPPAIRPEHRRLAPPRRRAARHRRDHDAHGDPPCARRTRRCPSPDSSPRSATARSAATSLGRRRRARRPARGHPARRPANPRLPTHPRSDRRRAGRRARTAVGAPTTKIQGPPVTVPSTGQARQQIRQHSRAGRLLAARGAALPRGSNAYAFEPSAARTCDRRGSQGSRWSPQACFHRVTGTGASAWPESGMVGISSACPSMRSYAVSATLLTRVGVSGSAWPFAKSRGRAASRDSETRTRTGDTTIFSRAVLAFRRRAS